MSRSDTINLLNDADDISRKLDWILFKAEVEHIWSGSSKEWRPGDPIHQVPIYKHVLYGLLEATGQQYIRPMIEFIDPDGYFEPDTGEWVETGEMQEPRCIECMTFWVGPDPCFSCGTKIEQCRPMPIEFEDQDSLSYTWYADDPEPSWENPHLPETYKEWYERYSSEFRSAELATTQPVYEERPNYYQRMWMQWLAEDREPSNRRQIIVSGRRMGRSIQAELMQRQLAAYQVFFDTEETSEQPTRSE